MSKNGKRIFKNFDPYITSSFGNRISPTTGKEQFHTGVDYGTNGKNLEQYAITDGTILRVGYNDSEGNYVYVSFPSLGYVGKHVHLDKVMVKPGQNVDTNTVIGTTGATGNATGVHLHFCWFKVEDYPKDYFARKYEDFEKYEFFQNNIVSPVEANDSADQLEVVIDNLNLREGPNGKILGLTKKGRYNILGSEVNGDYLWYKIGDRAWVAYNDNWIELYLKGGKLREIFTTPKNGMYKIYLEKGDKLYLEY